jgi:gliding motility-associated-like protein
MKKSLLILVMSLIGFSPLYATHQRAGEITYKALGELTYEFTIVTYTYTPSPADRPQLELDWGDGTSSVVPRTEKINYPNNISRNVYAGAVHVFPGQGTYVISLEDPNRNYGVLNIPNSVNVPFFIQTELVINPFLGPNNSVELLAPPIDNGCVNSLYLHNPGAYDSDGDSISYKLVDCRGAFGLPIPGYVLPNQVNTTVPTTFSIDPVTGTILWDKPIMQGEYNIAFLIEEWRSGVRIGYVTRDMQITIIPCDNHPPVIAPVNDTCVMAGETLTFTVSATDPDDDELVIRALGGPLVLEDHPASFPPAMGQGTVSSIFTWNTVCPHVQHQPYQVVFTAKDTFSFPQLSDIKTVNITVISPPPQNPGATPAGNSIYLSWDRALCDKAIGYEIYRRDGFYGFVPGVCETGVPEYTGYVKIGYNEGITDTTFTDDNNGNGLIHGIDYCYMIVTTFADGAVSYASEEVCASLRKDAPIITNVSVEKTGKTDGKIYVAWSKPTEFDTLLFPPPYRYVINRADNSQPSSFVKVDSTNNINDTTYVNTGLNTKETIYIYRIDFYSVSSGQRYFVGSTQRAKSMHLKLSPSDNSMQLNWNVNVPWSNQYYTIFRKDPGTTVYDSVGFSNEPGYFDNEVINGQQYSYFIRAFGKYSTGGLVDPIINLSQIATGIPVDNVPPCAPQLSVTTECDATQNILTWVNPSGCPVDIAKYYIYYSPVENQDLTIIDSINDPEVKTFRHTGLSSIAGCYSVTAVDSVGNQSEFSNTICISISECSLYSLPNVFTPNGDGINDYFHAYPYTSVDRIELRIFNRWGRVVYETSDPAFKWDGKNKNNNSICSTGAYFYVCDVYEIGLEGLTKRTITGSVSIFR